MGNLVTKVTTNSVELNESNASDIVVYEQQPQVKKDKETPMGGQMKAGLFKSMFMGNLDPRSPSTFIARTPIQIFRSVSSSKFNHQTLMNESLNESVEIDILTPEEQDSLDSNKDLVDAISKETPSETQPKQEKKEDEAANEQEEEEEKLPDPRSPTTEIVRTPILTETALKKTDTNLMKKIADKLIATKISNDFEELQNRTTPTGVTNNNSKKKSKTTQKNLIYEDDEGENHDRFSTPPKKAGAIRDGERTPLSCVANRTRGMPRMTSTPKGSKIPVSVNREHHQSASRIPRRIE